VDGEQTSCLAPQDQLQSVLHALRRIEVGIHKVSQMFGEGTRNLVAAFQVNHDRLNRVQTILGIYRKNIDQTHDNLYGLHQNERVGKALMIKMAKLMMESQFRLADADSLYTATQLILAGHLPHFFISHVDMASAIDEVKSHLLVSNPHMHLVREDFAFYYHSADFKAFLIKNETNQTHLVLLLDCPITLDILNHDYSVYKLVTFPLPTPQSDSFYSLLTTDIRFLIKFSNFQVTSYQLEKFGFWTKHH